jgi:shikimate kinase
MGSGKTTLGKRLAKKLNLQFLDVDLFIENRYHKTISSIFEEKGEDGFREIERRTLHEIAGFENIVISTGGGLPCFFDNIDVMNKAGITIYLKVNPDELANRLNSRKSNRPLIKGKTPEELKDFIQINLKKREGFYNKASIIYAFDDLFTKENIDINVANLIIYLSEKS